MFGIRLKALRKERGITQEKLAQIVNIDRSSIGKYEGKSKVIPSEEVRQAIADYFGVSVDYLMGRTDIRYPNPANRLTDDEVELLGIFRSLNSKGKESIMQYARERTEIPSMQEAMPSIVTA
ncbi:MAG: helix-turn-helix transcriptional regulator [Clostridia bacterium]|nr:helix-turn-helix transcriptional regulator [Clostridia bacterium]